MENRPEYFEVCWAAQRSGLFYTCINWHFTAEEAAYILDDCDAQVLVISDAYRELAAELADKMPRVKRAAHGRRSLVDGYEPYAEARDRYPAEPLAEEIEGTPMLYSSGTTGRPKGIKYQIHEGAGRLDARGDGHAHRDLRHGRRQPCTCRPRRCTTRRRCSTA